MPAWGSIDFATQSLVRYISNRCCVADDRVHDINLTRQAAHMNPTLPTVPRVTQDVQLSIGDSINVGQHRVTVADVHGGDIRFHIETLDSNGSVTPEATQPETPK